MMAHSGLMNLILGCKSPWVILLANEARVLILISPTEYSKLKSLFLIVVPAVFSSICELETEVKCIVNRSKTNLIIFIRLTFIKSKNSPFAIMFYCWELQHKAKSKPAL
jgi:hypothetical protein